MFFDGFFGTGFQISWEGVDRHVDLDGFWPLLLVSAVGVSPLFSLLRLVASLLAPVFSVLQLIH